MFLIWFSDRTVIKKTPNFSCIPAIWYSSFQFLTMLKMLEIQGFLKACIASKMSRFWQLKWGALSVLGKGFPLLMNVNSTRPRGFLSIVRRNVSGTWQLLGVTKANKQTKRLEYNPEIFCSPICGLAATSPLEKYFILLLSSAGGVSICQTVVCVF